MDLRQLRYFLALVEHRSFVRAADAMGITQPAFSRSIQGLESELGCLLVDRGNKDLRPTPEGQLVAQHARALVRGASNLTNEIGRMTKLDRGELYFGCGPIAAARLVPDALAHFSEAHPRIHTRLEVSNGESLGRSLLREDIEFCVSETLPFEADPNFQIRPLSPRRLAFFCSGEHPLLHKDSLSTNDLFDYPLASAHLGVGLRKVLANLSGKSDFQLHLECEQTELLVQHVQRTQSIGISTREALQQRLVGARLVQLSLRNLPASLESQNLSCGVITRTGYRLSAAALAMIDLLIELDRQQAQIIAA